jgi:hypothetical protein
MSKKKYLKFIIIYFIVMTIIMSIIPIGKIWVIMAILFIISSFFIQLGWNNYYKSPE